MGGVLDSGRAHKDDKKPGENNAKESALKQRAIYTLFCSNLSPDQDSPIQEN
jgi:hypothetical protein